MDVAVLSNPTNATGNCSIQLYRLSGGSNAPVTPSITSESTHSSSKVWEASLDSKAVVIDGPAPAKRAGATKSEALEPAAALTYIQPRAPETLQWRPDGTGFAFASTAGNYNIYSVHDGKPVMKHSPLALDEEAPIYLLNWERILPPDTNIPRESINAESLESRLPKLSTVKKVHEKQASKPNTFINPFAAGFSKPYVPAVPFSLGRFPAVPSSDTPDSDMRNVEEEPDLIPDGEAEEELRLVENPTLLTLGHSGSLHLLYNGAVVLGSIDLGSDVDIIAAAISRVITKPKTPFNRATHALELSVIASAGQQDGAKYPHAVGAALPQGVPSDVATVMNLTVRIPRLPSIEVSNLARASTAINTLLAHAFEAFDEARKGWEEVRGMGRKWLDRLRDDSHSLLPELQLLTLLLTGRPSNANMHEYFASKNTERNLENWETNHLKAAARIRDTAFQSLTPVCERLMLWLAQLRGWALWPDRFGHLQLDLEQIEQCFILIRLLMARSSLLEEMALEEEIGFREFCGWVKFDLERISAIEANADARPTPKHDVLGVTAYIRQKLPSNRLDEILQVDDRKAAAHYVPVLHHWITLQREATSPESFEKGRKDLANVLHTCAHEFSQLGLHSETIAGLAEDARGNDNATNGCASPQSEYQVEEERLFIDPPAMPSPIIKPAQNTRRKSTMSNDQKSNLSLKPVELPIAVLLADLARRLRTLFDQVFATVARSAEIVEARPIITWKPPDIEEDDALAVLGLARDPTKITSRVVRDVGEDEQSCVFIACETPPHSLPEHPMSDPAFWIFRITGSETSARAFALLSEVNGNPYEILDIDFFDDQEVALLLRHPADSGSRARHSLATVGFRDLELLEVAAGDVGPCLSGTMVPVPLRRLHRFESPFEPLQLSLNGRAGRRIAAVLGGSGRILEVLDMDDPEEEEDAEATGAEEESAFE